MPRSAPTLLIEPGFSAALLGFIASTHGAALLASLLSGWPGWIKIGCVLAIVSSSGVIFDRYLRRPAVKTLQLSADGAWRVTLRDGRECRCELSGDSIVTAIFTLLILQSPSRTWRVLVFRDSLDARAYRQLRVALVVRGLSGVGKGAK